MSAADATLLVLLIGAMSAVLIVIFFVIPLFTFDPDGEIKTRRPQLRIRNGRRVKRTRKKP